MPTLAHEHLLDWLPFAEMSAARIPLQIPGDTTGGLIKIVNPSLLEVLNSLGAVVASIAKPLGDRLNTIEVENLGGFGVAGGKPYYDPETPTFGQEAVFHFYGASAEVVTEQGRWSLIVSTGLESPINGGTAAGLGFLQSVPGGDASTSLFVQVLAGGAA